MPSIRYINQSAPFWDFIASLEQQGVQHPFANANASSGEEGEEQNHGWGPWGRGFPHRPHPHHHHGRRGGPPPPPPPEGPSDEEGTIVPPYEEKEGSPATEKGEPSSQQPREGPAEGREGRRGRCGVKGKHGHEGKHGHGHGHGPFGGRGRGGHGFGGRGGGPPWARGGFPFGRFGGLGDFFNESRETGNDNFKPEVDVFDTESAYVLHLSLPGAKKEDIGVSWDSEKSELSVAGVVHRPGDEEFLQTLAMDERKVGAFERKVRLGSFANPANVDVDAITAKLEDGILRVEVPKLDKDYVEVKMVDIE